MKFISIQIVFIFSTIFGFISTVSGHDETNEKIQIDLYFESKCPGSGLFIVDQLAPTEKALGKYLTITLYPYGNAKEKFDGSKYVFTCQHGPEECLGNTILACVISMTNQSIYVPFTVCLMANLDPVHNFQKCIQQYNLNSLDVSTCVNGEKGNDLEHKNAVATDSLDPKHKYVPWVVINKVFSNNNEDSALVNLKKLVCGLLKPSPPECTTTNE